MGIQDKEKLYVNEMNLDCDFFAVVKKILTYLFYFSCMIFLFSGLKIWCTWVNRSHVSTLVEPRRVWGYVPPHFLKIWVS